MTKAVSEQELQEKSVAPRVTKEQIDALMDQVKVHTVAYLEPTPHVLAVAWLDDKFQLGTAISKAIDPENFSEELGVKYATKDVLALAESKLWELEGYRLFQKGKRWCEAVKIYNLTNGNQQTYKTLVLAEDGDEDDALALAQERFELNGQEKPWDAKDWIDGYTDVFFLKD